jgi:hypothetical protein
MTNGGGYVNLAHVKTARRIATKSPGADIQLLDEADEWIGTIGESQLETMVEQIIAPAEPYDCLQIWFEDDDTYFVAVDDVIAWALCASGWIYPVCTDDIGPRVENYALRRRGQNRIDVPMDQSFDNEAAWVASEVKRRARDKEREAAKSAAQPK